MPECRRGVSGLLIASPQAVGCAQQGVDDAVLDDLEDGAAFEGVSKYPNRVKCALLGWMALKDALAKSGVALPAVEPNAAE